MSAEPNCTRTESNCAFCPHPDTIRMACVAAYESSSGPGWSTYAHIECAAANAAPALFTVDTDESDRRPA
ncbi:hypothetical protein [Streptomyces sp. NPDC055709]